MKHVLSFLIFLLALTANAAEVTYDFTSAVPKAWTSNPAPFGFEATNRGTQYTSNATLTLTGAKDVSKVVIVCSSNIANQNSISVSVGGTKWGTETLAKEANVKKTFSGNATSGNIVVSIERTDKSVYIKSITVTGDVEDSEGGDQGGQGGGNGSTELDPNYTYGEPTTVTYAGETTSNTPYSFIKNNIKVECSTGAQSDTYFGCNAGNSLTFTATKPIKGISINGYVKKDFTASTTAGILACVDASLDAVENDPVVVLLNVDATSVTINCEKQLRCYSVDVYFTSNPDVDIDEGDEGEGGDEDEYTYDWEPKTKTNINVEFTDAEYTDWSEYLGYPYTDIYLFNGSKEQPDYEVELAIFAPSASGTAIAPGTYQVTDDFADGTVQASPGGNDFYDFPSYITTDYEWYQGESDEDSGWFYNTTYYITSGTLTVANDPAGVKITFSGSSYNGSTINLSFTGKPVNLDDEEDIEGVGTIMAQSASATNGKYMGRTGISIRKDGKTYNIRGLRKIQ